MVFRDFSSFFIKSFLILFSFCSLVIGQSENEIRVGNIEPGELDMAAFTLLSDATIEIEGRGASFGDWDKNIDFYGWIIKSDSRKVVWHLRDWDDYDEGDGIFNFDEEVFLREGDYEVYYSGTTKNYAIVHDKGFESFCHLAFDLMIHR